MARLRSRATAACLGALWAGTCAAGPAAAQAEPPARQAPKASAPAPDEASDLSDIEAALAADRADGSGSTAADTGASTPSGSGGRAEALAARPPSTGLMNPDLSFIFDFAGAYFSDDAPLQTGGHDPTETGFNLQQLELSISSVVDPYLRFDGNIVFGLFGVEIEEAYGTALTLPGRLQARFGQFLHRFGRINPTHPHSWDFVDQPFAIGRVFGSEGGRGLGIELSWLSPLPWYVEVIGSVQHPSGEATSRSFGARDVEDPRDLVYVGAVKQFFPLSSAWSLLWGLSGAYGRNDTGRDNHTAIYGSDLYLKWRPADVATFTTVSWQTELFYRRRQIPGALLADASGYTQLFWRFAQRWGTAARYEYGSPAVTEDAATGLDPLDPAWTDSRHRVSANLTHWPTEFSRFRLQGARDMPDWRDHYWSVFFAVELVTGAHGSHDF